MERCHFDKCKENMTKQISVVIGTNYGDEGKGLVTDFLANMAGPSTAIVRFNGGAQAGHTVQLANGCRHVFHHFGSGTFCYAATILSRFFIVNPTLFFKEARELYLLLDKQFRVFADPEATVTTPFDVYINQSLEKQRSNQRHGSCGIGIGETIERTEQGFPLTVYDLGLPNLRSKLEEIRDVYFPRRLRQLGLEQDNELLKDAIDTFILDSNAFIDVVNVMSDERAIRLFDNIIFEGAQGLRLDQYGSDFPYVTRSSTGLENVATLIKNIEAEIHVYYLTRTYLTRHGAGPLLNEYSNFEIEDKTNIPNDYQGTLRFAPLDFEIMKKCVEKDKKFLEGREFDTRGVITCCDQLEFTESELAKLIKNVMDSLDTKYIITSWGPTRETFHHTPIDTLDRII